MSEEVRMVRGKFYMVGVFGLIGLIIVIMAVLIGTGRDTTTYLAFTAPVLTALLSQVVLSKQVDEVRQAVAKVEEQTNGQLAAQFASLESNVKDHIDATVAPNE